MNHYNLSMSSALKLTVLTLLIGLAGCEYIPFSGGQLQGQLSSPAPGWPEIADAQVIQIETNPTEPYSVKLWVVVLNGMPYIHAGKNRATWVEHLEQDPSLKLGYAGKLYELRAERVTTQEEFDRFAALWEEKYGNPPRNLIVSDVYAYRLTSR